MNPMVPFLTGFLLSSLSLRGSDAMKIVGITPLPPDAFDVAFASGLVVRVTIAEKAAESKEK